MLTRVKAAVKQLLRMCGHAATVTVHERLDHFERQLDDLSLRVASLAESQEALLRASIYLVEEQRRGLASDPEASPDLEQGAGAATGTVAPTSSVPPRPADRSQLPARDDSR
jgi:hypothetical protein